jgi:hypothetical protein
VLIRHDASGGELLVIKLIGGTCFLYYEEGFK